MVPERPAYMMRWAEGLVNGDVTRTAFLCSYVLIPRNTNFIKILLSLKLPINLSKLAND